jgi:Ca-activated chloride channel family protein
VSFQDPLLLLPLLALPLALLAYVVAQRRARRYAVRFPALDVLAEVVGERRGGRWARHLPAALLGLAALALTVALARPQVTVAVPVEQATVMLVTDVSGSMRATDVEPNRLEAARTAAERFLDRVPEEARIGLATFSEFAQVVQEPTDEHDEVRVALATLLADGGTAAGDGMAVALEQLRRARQEAQDEREGARPPAAIILLSDGASMEGRDPVEVAQEARRLRVPVFTVALGTPDGYVTNPLTGLPQAVPPDPATLRRVAQITGGRSFDAERAGDLDAVYDRLGRSVAARREPREVTAAFAAGGLLLLAGGLAAALRRRGAFG